MNIEQANTVPIFDFLDKLNIKPHKHKGHRATFLSPLRSEEKTASFSVNIRKNCWYDHGLGIGGDVVGFVCKYLEYTGADHTTFDALRYIENIWGHSLPVAVVEPEDGQPGEPTFSITSLGTIEHDNLVKYLAARGISLELAQTYLKQAKIYNSEKQKHFVALALANDEEGYEIRNAHIKNCIGKKDVTVIRGTDEKRIGVHIFEGFMDFLSVLEYKKVASLKEDAIILNSVTMLGAAAQLIENYFYRTVYSWMDNDLAGMRATIALDDFIKAQKKLRHMPMNDVYSCKDVNEWYMRRRGLKAI